MEDELAVIVYPEGTLTRDPDLWPMRGKFGAVRLALQFGVPVIPAATWGAQQVLPRWSKRLSVFPRKTIDVLIGDPVDLSAWAGRQDAAALTEATTAVMQAITALLEADSRRDRAGRTLGPGGSRPGGVRADHARMTARRRARRAD